MKGAARSFIIPDSSRMAETVKTKQQNLSEKTAAVIVSNLHYETEGKFFPGVFE